MANLPSPAIPGCSFDRFDEITDLVERHPISPSPGIGDIDVENQRFAPAWSDARRNKIGHGFVDVGQ
jgi:hypothetical protein